MHCPPSASMRTPNKILLSAPHSGGLGDRVPQGFWEVQKYWIDKAKSIDISYFQSQSNDLGLQIGEKIKVRISYFSEQKNARHFHLWLLRVFVLCLGWLCPPNPPNGRQKGGSFWFDKYTQASIQCRMALYTDQLTEKTPETLILP